MDLTTTALPLPTKSPDSENDTPPHDIQPIKSLSFTNGVLKNHHPHRHNHHHRHNRPSPLVVTYKECLKNHAASMGGHALDGCGEFMSSTTTNSVDPTSLKCAACGCHRNFHRQEPDEYFSPTITTATTTHFLEFQRHPPPPPPPPPTTRRFSSSPSHSHSHSPSPSLSHSPPPIQQSYPPNMLLALSTMHDNSQPMNHHHHHHHHVARPVTPTTLKGENSSGRKRSRTKFTQEQKEKMHSFSEKIGWKLQKVNESMVGQFCDEIGVARGVLKVWMHNNKHTFSKKDMNNINGGGVENGKVLSIEINNNGGHNIDDESQNGNIGSVHLHVSNNESSSTS